LGEGDAERQLMIPRCSEAMAAAFGRTPRSTRKRVSVSSTR
jgi:hypothetical protein